MPHRACPVCRVQGRLLEDTSKEALVEYYRCDKCGRIWTHRKADPNSPPTLVTVKAKTLVLKVKPKARAKLVQRKQLLFKQTLKAGSAKATVYKRLKLIRR